MQRLFDSYPGLIACAAPHPTPTHPNSLLRTAHTAAGARSQPRLPAGWPVSAGVPPATLEAFSEACLEALHLGLGPILHPACFPAPLCGPPYIPVQAHSTGNSSLVTSHALPASVPPDLHHRRILHLDLKPHNVLMASDGTAKIGDVGFARRAGTECRCACTAL